MRLGNKILELRKSMEMTQEELAAELGVTAAAVSKWEKGISLPDVLMLVAIADFFQVSTDELLGRTRYMKKAIVVTTKKDFARKVEALARQYGMITEAVCDTYQEAKAIAHKDRDISYFLLCEKNPEVEKDSERELGNITVFESDCSSEEQTLCVFEMLFRSLDN